MATGISASLADFLSKCFQRDPALRVSAKELTSHPWLRKKEAEEETTVEDAAKKIAGHKQMLHMVKTEVREAGGEGGRVYIYVCVYSLGVSGGVFRS